LPLPLPPRPVRLGGQPHLRTACARARPLRLRGDRRTLGPGHAVQRQSRRRRGKERQDPQVQAHRAGRACRRLGADPLPHPASALVAVTTRTRKSARRRQLEAAINYPIDWIEERSGLIGGLRYFLFRKVPGDTNWFHTLGSATLTAFLVQALTGVILAMYYKPDATVNPAPRPSAAYGSIQHITNDLTLGCLVRGMHKWGASVFIILLFFH